VQAQDGEALPREFADWREIPSDALEHRELREALARALRALPDIYRSVFVLRDVQKLSIRETANLLGLTEAGVKTRLLRARLQMREALAPGLGGAWARPDITARSPEHAVHPAVQ
jgi:RNA polymerase sigma-70 factor (ECF subfamily)